MEALNIFVCRSDSAIIINSGHSLNVIGYALFIITV
jgi:hypothetical protein